MAFLAASIFLLNERARTNKRASTSKRIINMGSVMVIEKKLISTANVTFIIKGNSNTIVTDFYGSYAFVE
jgi:hypothetical protein